MRAILGVILIIALIGLTLIVLANRHDDLQLSTTACETIPPTISPTIPPKLKFGVTIWGYIRGEFGVGEATRAVAAAVVAAGIPLNIVDISVSFSHSIPHSMGDHTFDNYTNDLATAPNYFNIICINPENSKLVWNYITKKFSIDHYNIGIWWWELESFPKGWETSFSLYDEIWAGSMFVRQALYSYVPRAPIPVTRVRFPLPSLQTSQLQQKLHSRSHFNISEKAFVFLFNFDYYSVSARKNPRGLVKAFRHFLRLLKESNIKSDRQPL